MNLREELQERVDLIQHKLKFIEQKPTVACIEKLEPMLIANMQFAQLVAIAGGVAVNGDIIQQGADIIVVMPTGFSIKQTIKEIGSIIQLQGFAQVNAVKNNRLYIADGARYFNEQTIVDSIEILAEIINPKLFVFGYEGDGWVKFTV